MSVFALGILKYIHTVCKSLDVFKSDSNKKKRKDTLSLGAQYQYSLKTPKKFHS